MRSWSDTYGPGRADVVVDFEQVQVAIENLDPSVSTIRHVDIPFRVRRDRVGCIHLSGLRSTSADGFDEPAVLVVLRDARVAVSVRDKNVARRIPRDIRRTIE